MNPYKKIVPLLPYIEQVLDFFYIKLQRIAVNYIFLRQFLTCEKEHLNSYVCVEYLLRNQSLNLYNGVHLSVRMEF